MLDDKLQEWRIDDSKKGSQLAQLLPQHFGSLIAADYYFTSIVLGRCVQIRNLFAWDESSVRWIEGSKAMNMQAFKGERVRVHKHDKYTKEHTNITVATLTKRRLRLLLSLSGGQMRDHAQTLRSMSKHVPDKEALSNVVQYLDDLGSTVDGHARMSEMDKDARDIKQALLGMHLKSVADVDHVVGASVQMQFPGTADPPKSRSKDFHARTRFQVDMAYMLLMRDASFMNCFL